MSPSVEQLRRWSVVSDDGTEVTLPSSAWIEVLWLLETFEKIEDNPAVQAAFADAHAPAVSVSVTADQEATAGSSATNEGEQA